MKNILSQQYLIERLIYSPDTGIFVWRNGHRAGRVAGCRFSNGYINIGICKKMVGAHRLAWLYVHGFLPEQIDHKNCNRNDNRINNLRPATTAQNGQNCRPKKTSNSGLKGIAYCHDHKKWRALIGPRGRVKHLGYFSSPELAHEAYVLAAHEMYGEFARTA